MIINPSIHTAIPGRNAFQRRSQYRRNRIMAIPGGKQLWFAAAKCLPVLALLFFVASLWLGSTVTGVDKKIELLSRQHNELVTENVLLRAKKAQLFSREAVGLLAGDELAIHLPQSGQYRKF